MCPTGNPMRIKLLFLLFFPSVILQMQRGSRTEDSLSIYIGNDKRSVHFVDSTAILHEGGLKYSLSIKDSLTIQCDVTNQNRLVQSGQYALSDTFHRPVIHEISDDLIELTGDLFIEKVFRMHGNWVWHGPKDNTFYHYGKELPRNPFLAYIKEVDDLVHLEEPRTILNLNNSTYIFEKDKTENEISVWKFSNNSSTWFYGKLEKLSLDTNITYKAGKYDHGAHRRVVVDSVFQFPVYDISEDWNQMDK